MVQSALLAASIAFWRESGTCARSISSFSHSIAALTRAGAAWSGGMLSRWAMIVWSPLSGQALMPPWGARGSEGGSRHRGLRLEKGMDHPRFLHRGEAPTGPKERRPWSSARSA